MEPRQQMTLKDYLILSQKRRIEPSFFHTIAYLELAGAEAYSNEHWAWVECEGWIMFTPVFIASTIQLTEDGYDHFPNKNIWCANLKDEELFTITYQPQFLDFEYIFDPAAFKDMSGGKWNTFRKNVRKWPRENPNHKYTSELINFDDLSALMGVWLEGRSDKAEDAELMINMALNIRPDVQRSFMYNEAGELVGMNVWDESWKYVNYNLCVVKPGERFLDEFMRYKFYTMPPFFFNGKKVNDGGTLGREGLERFKDKMNPAEKRKRYSLIKANKS